MAPRSLCGNFLTNKRSLVAFTWTITTVLTLVAVMLAVVLCAHVHAHYIRMEHYYSELLNYQQQQREYYEQQQQEDGDENQQAWHSSDDQQLEMQLQLGAVGSSSMAAVAAYTVFLALGLSLYGSTTIVGFTSMRGVYIAPCFSASGGHPTMKIGLFGGAIIFFANLLLVSAIVLGEVRVEDWTEYDGNNNANNDNNGNYNGNNNDGYYNGNSERQGMEPYEIERIATILAVTCTLLAPIYIIFAVLLFFYFGGSTDQQLMEEEQGDVGDNNAYFLSSEHEQHGVTSFPPPQGQSFAGLRGPTSTVPGSPSKLNSSGASGLPRPDNVGQRQISAPEHSHLSVPPPPSSLGNTPFMGMRPSQTNNSNTASVPPPNLL